MRVLYLDIDSLRPDHLGCYGYHRDTSPNIDMLAEESVRFENCYASDAPCLPSRTALWSGRFGFKTGVVNHGGVASQPFVEGPTRGFRDQFHRDGWMVALRKAGFKTVTVSPFGERHAAWHWYSGFNEIYNTGRNGLERADEITPTTLDWLSRNGKSDNWFLYVNLWDPHTPYRTPLEYGNPFEDVPLPEHYTEAYRQRAWDGYGPHSAQDVHGWGTDTYYKDYPRLPAALDSMETLKQWIDGYDIGIRYADDHIGQIIEKMRDLGIYEDTVIIVSADHGENQGELNVWGDHQTADQPTCRIPLIIRWPDVIDSASVNRGLHYHFDWAATLIELAGGQVPKSWDGRSFASDLRSQTESGRDYLVISQTAWACQRAVRFDRYLCIRSYHSGYKQVAPIMLFDLVDDPYEQNNIAEQHPELVAQAMKYLADWQHDMMVSSSKDVDPMMTALREGGPYHTRGELAPYVEHLRATGRGHHADHLLAQHAAEL